MAGRQVPCDRGDARQQRGARSWKASPGPIPGRTPGSTQERNSGRNGHVRLGVELVLGWIAVWVMVAMIVAFANTIAPAVVPYSDTPLIEQWQSEITDDPEHPGPRDPLVFCTAHVTHSHCIREAS